MSKEGYPANAGGANTSTIKIANALGVSRRTLQAFSRNELNLLEERLTGKNVQGLNRVSRALYEKYAELTNRNESYNNNDFQAMARNQDRINRAYSNIQGRVWEESRKRRR